MTSHKIDSAKVDNVAVDVVVELGRSEITLGQARRLKENDIIDFDKLAGEAFDILLNQRQFAEGEIVVVTDQMAVRITRILDRKSPDHKNMVST